MTMTPNTVTQLNDSYKILYSDRLKYLLPEQFRYWRDISAKKGRLGQSYNWPVVLKQEQGFTFKKAGGGEVTFNNTVPGIIKSATTDGFQMFGWCGIDYETAAKGANSRQSFVDSVGHIIESLDLSAKRRIEMLGWYGQSGLAEIESVSYTDDTTVTNDYIVISKATWAPAMWVGAEGMRIDIFDTTFATKRNHTNYPFCIKKVDMVNRRLYLSQYNDVTEVEADDLHDTVATDKILFQDTRDVTGTAYWNEQQGIDSILNAANTTLFGITCADYSLWQSNSYAVGSTVMSVEAIQEIAAQAIPKGMEGRVKLYMNPNSVSKMITDIGGLRRFTSQEGNKYTVGANDITVHCQGVLVDIVSHPFIWEGSAYMFNPEIFGRVQAYPLSSKVPGRGDDLFQLTGGKGSYSMQLYSNEVLTTDAPCQGVRVTGIVN